MDLVKMLSSALLGALLFAAFVPGVLVRLPPGASTNVVLVVHGLLFAFVLHMVMKWFWSRESFGNYGPSCPNGYTMMSDQTCVPTGKATY